MNANYQVFTNSLKIYRFLGLSCGYINNDQTDDERKKNYNCDITYATNAELGFDYLRDNMKLSQETIVQRGHSYAIVDEVDSCLIDEARTPLVISGAVEDKSSQYLAIDKLIKNLGPHAGFPFRWFLRRAACPLARAACPSCDPRCPVLNAFCGPRCPTIAPSAFCFTGVARNLFFADWLTD